jgi:hypothetical protein
MLVLLGPSRPGPQALYLGVVRVIVVMLTILFAYVERIRKIDLGKRHR